MSQAVPPNQNQPAPVPRDPALTEEVTLGEVWRTLQRVEKGLNRLADKHDAASAENLPERVRSLESFRTWATRSLVTAAVFLFALGAGIVS